LGNFVLPSEFTRTKAKLSVNVTRSRIHDGVIEFTCGSRALRVEIHLEALEYPYFVRIENYGAERPIAAFSTDSSGVGARPTSR